MKSIQFYNVKTRSKVDVPLSEVTTTTFERTAKNGDVQTRYAARAEQDGMKLVKFIKKELFDELGGED